MNIADCTPKHKPVLTFAQVPLGVPFKAKVEHTSNPQNHLTSIFMKVNYATSLGGTPLENYFMDLKTSLVYHNSYVNMVIDCVCTNHELVLR